MGTRHQFLPGRMRPPKPTFLCDNKRHHSGHKPQPKGGICIAVSRAGPAKTLLGRGDFLAEVSGPNPVVGEQFSARAVQHELAGLEHITAVGQC